MFSQVAGFMTDATLIAMYMILACCLLQLVEAELQLAEKSAQLAQRAEEAVHLQAQRDIAQRDAADAKVGACSVMRGGVQMCFKPKP